MLRKNTMALASFGVSCELGISARRFTEMAVGEWHGHCGKAPCPICQPECRQDQRALSIGYNDERVLVYCHKLGCRYQDIMLALDLPFTDNLKNRSLPNPVPRTRREPRSHNIGKARALWQKASSANCTPAESYLRNRGITCPLPTSLRYVSREYCTVTHSYHPTMVALIHPTDGVHRTFLHRFPEGSKAVDKRMLGPCRGGAVRCSDGSGPIVACEGIETGLSLASGLVSGEPRVWAALSASGMKALELPRLPEQLIIATDGDNAGRKAGQVLAQKAGKLGWKNEYYARSRRSGLE